MADKGAAPQKKGGKKQDESKKGKPRSAGRQTAKYDKFSPIRWAEKILRRVLKHNGEAEARKWATAHGPTPERLLEKLLRERRERRTEKEARKGDKAFKPEVQKGPCGKKPIRQRRPAEITLVITSGMGPLTMPMALALVSNIGREFRELPTWLDASSPDWRKRKPVMAKKKRRRQVAKKAASAKPRRPVSAKKALADFFTKKKSVAARPRPMA
ncbi:MAG: hypothetical protein WD989_00400 [Candidatus Paceibacterota bacterium]